jgi:hypothetical protein
MRIQIRLFILMRIRIQILYLPNTGSHPWKSTQIGPYSIHFTLWSANWCGSGSGPGSSLSLSCGSGFWCRSGFWCGSKMMRIRIHNTVSTHLLRVFRSLHHLFKACAELDYEVSYGIVLSCISFVHCTLTVQVSIYLKKGGGLCWGILVGNSLD